MLLGLFNGFSAWEMVYWVPKTGPNKGKITLRKIDWRPSETSLSCSTARASSTGSGSGV